jgi:hypothetical protein
MRSQTLQVAGIVALGAVISLSILRPWRAVSPPVAAALPAVTSETAPVVQTLAPPPLEAPRTDSAVPPPARTFRLPAVASAAPEIAAKPKQETAKRPPPAAILVPKDWLLRGTGPESYEVRSDKAEVFTGQASVRMASLKKDIPTTAFASLLQTAVAAPWVGQRVEFSMSTKREGLRMSYDVWIRAIDAGNVVIAYDEAQMFAAKPDWKRATATIDVPWSAAEIAYGVNLHGVGTLHVDNAQLEAIDKSLPAPTHNIPAKLGVMAQDANKNGALATPSNLDFEDVGPADESFREAPKDQVNRTRF